jgi:hypothetical protein
MRLSRKNVQFPDEVVKIEVAHIHCPGDVLGIVFIKYIISISSYLEIILY